MKLEQVRPAVLQRDSRRPRGAVGRDLMHQHEIRASVREAYLAISAGSGRVAERLYSSDQLGLVPDVADGALGIASAALQAGLDNVETVEAEMEATPFPIDSVDYVISNGTINLSPRKQRVVAECARVLRPRGTLTVAGLTRIHERQPLGIDDLALMRRQIPPRRCARSGSPS